MQSIRDADYLSQQSPRLESRDRMMTLVDQLSDTGRSDGDGNDSDEGDHNTRPHHKVFALITMNDTDGLAAHLEKHKDNLDLTQILNSSGFTPLHLAAYKS